MSLFPQVPDLPESTYSIVILQEAYTKLPDEPPEAPSVPHFQVQFVGHAKDAEEAQYLLQMVPQVHHGAVRKKLHDRSLIGRVRVGAYAIETRDDPQGRTLSRMVAFHTRLDTGDEDADKANLAVNLRDMLKGEYKPTISTTFMLPCDSVPPWRAETTEEIVEALTKPGLWGLGKAID